MIRIALVIVIVIFTLNNLDAQREDFVWVFGDRDNIEYKGSEVDFQTNPPTVRGRTAGAPRLKASNTSICSEDGELLFYTDGLRIYDRRHQVMQNGDSLHNNEYSNYLLLYPLQSMDIKQNIIILPWPGRDSMYFVMHHSMPFDYLMFGNNSLDLLYSTVDMRKNNGYGKVKTKNKLLLSDALVLGRLTTCRHANGRDWWILARKADGQVGFHRFLLDPDGIHYMGEQQIGDPMPFDGVKGQATFSPDGKHLAFLSAISIDHRLDLFDFNRCTGMLSNKTQLYVPNELDSVPSHGVAFSPSGRYLYGCNSYQVHQYDLKANDIQASRQVVGEITNYIDADCEGLEYFFSHMQLAPNGKIYITGQGNCQLSEIRFPDKLGAACTVVPHSLQLKTVSSTGGMPQFPSIRLGPKDGSACDTLEIERPPVARFRSDSLNPYEFRFTDISWYHPTGWQWSFGDGTSDTVPHPDHTYADTGRYKVCLTVINEDGEDTYCDTVHVTDYATDIDLPAARNKSLTVYPVPAREEITIEGVEVNQPLFIFNLQGRLVDRMEVNTPTVQYNISHLKPGIYWIRTVGQTAKFIRIR